MEMRGWPFPEVSVGGEEAFMALGGARGRAGGLRMSCSTFTDTFTSNHRSWTDTNTYRSCWRSKMFGPKLLLKQQKWPADHMLVQTTEVVSVGIVCCVKSLFSRQFGLLDHLQQVEIDSNTTNRCLDDDRRFLMLGCNISLRFVAKRFDSDAKWVCSRFNQQGVLTLATWQHGHAHWKRTTWGFLKLKLEVWQHLVCKRQ